MGKKDANARLKNSWKEFHAKMDEHWLSFEPYIERIPSRLDDATLLAVHDILWNRIGSCRRTAVLEDRAGEKKAAKYWHESASTFAIACGEIRRLLGDRVFFDSRRERWSLKTPRIVWVLEKR